MADSRIPVSTYRLQLHRGFRFSDAQGLVPYLATLGITDCYTSPYLKARAGSTHGYDICDHTQLNPEVGTDADYASFTAALAAHGMGQVADFVPNHMGADENTNLWWRDVLENGPSSPFARFFDIDWRPVKDELEDKILLPILGDQYGRVLERGELQLAFEHGTCTLRYFDHDLPINPRQLPRILEYDIDALREALGDEDPAFLEYLSIITALRNLPTYTETDAERVVERHREKEVARERLQRVATASPQIAQHIARAVRAFNGVIGEPQSFQHLHALLEAQAYRLSYWRTASHEINYRRFFDINQLAGLRMDDPQVFEATHGLLLRLIGEGAVTGVRLDHIDGLFDPAEYLERLQRAVSKVDTTSTPFYVVTEKILSSGESLREDWPVAGTSGYDFLNDVNRLFIDRGNQRALVRLYQRFTHMRCSFAEVAYDSKKLIMDTPMTSELNVLAHALNRLSERDPRTRDFTLNSLRDALLEVVACFPIYRTYVTAAGFTDADREPIDVAVREARRRNPTMESSIFDFLRSVLLPEPQDERAPDERQLRVAFAMRVQQYTGPVQAKGIEDTAFYRYNLLVSMNEVGGDPERFGCTVAEFHAANAHRQQRWPHTMLATATHDTKRGEDARARLNALTELPNEWGKVLASWSRINASNRSLVDGQPAPDRNDRYLFYQTLLGVWPPGATQPRLPDASLLARVRDYMLKAVREAKVHTSWITENRAYEAAVIRFVERTLSGPTAPRFLAVFLPFQQRIARLGMVNSLAQLVLKVVSPGVPDFYQGTELWDLSLVDPDNRQPVDYELRRRLLGQLSPLLDPAAPGTAERVEPVRELLDHWEDGRIKLLLTAAALRLRRRLPAVFLAGTYEPLAVEGERAEHVVALARRLQDATVIAVVPRLIARLTTPEHVLPTGPGVWGDTRVLLAPELAGRTYRNAITGEEVRPTPADGRVQLSLGSVLQATPVAILSTCTGRVTSVEV